MALAKVQVTFENGTVEAELLGGSYELALPQGQNWASLGELQSIALDGDSRKVAFAQDSPRGSQIRVVDQGAS